MSVVVASTAAAPVVSSTASQLLQALDLAASSIEAAVALSNNHAEPADTRGARVWALAEAALASFDLSERGKSPLVLV
jgi:hypothetical protein